MICYYKDCISIIDPSGVESQAKRDEAWKVETNSHLNGSTRGEEKKRGCWCKFEGIMVGMDC